MKEALGGKMQIRRTAKRLSVPFILALVTVFSLVWTISKLQRPEYAALVIALVGFAFTLWLEAFREMSNRRRNKLGLLSQLRIELTQNNTDIKSVLETYEQIGEKPCNPAPLRTHAWLAAISSPYFTLIDASMIDGLISIYNRLDAANYHADVFKLIKYSPQETTWEAGQEAFLSRDLYVKIVKVIADQIDYVSARWRRRPC